MASLLCSLTHDVEVVPQRHFLERELVVEQLVGLQEAVRLGEDFLEHGIALFQEADIFVAEGLIVENFLDPRAIIYRLTQ